MAITLDLNPHEEEVLQDVLATYGYDSPTAFVRQILRMHKSDKKAARLESLASRMFPDGVKKPNQEG